MYCIKMARKILVIIIVFAIMVSLLSVCGTTSAEAESNNKTNKYNVVFITDSSGSMNETDPKNHRFDAIELFVGLSSNGGNKIGSVVFSDSVKAEYPMTEMKNKTDKEHLSAEIKKTEPVGWTNIGEALKKSVNMLKSSGEESIQSIMILLTDGNTEMQTSELMKKSIEDKEDAVETAREEGYKIYTICLNKDNSANVSELEQIASATGGEFKEVNNAEDLQNVFDMYYQMIYGTKSQKLVDQKVPESGVINNNFSVADVGVEEVNVVLFGQVEDTTLTSPDGKNYSNDEISDMSYSTDAFKIIKIEDPVAGTWKLSVNAKKGSVIKVFKIYNLNLSVKASQIGNPDECKVGEKIEILAELFEGEAKLTDMAKYSGYNAKLKVNDFEGNTVFETETSSPAEEGFKLEFVPDDYGTYYASVSVESDELFAEAGTLTFNVGNTSPIAKKETLKKSIYKWPFLLKTNPTMDLSEAASDAEDKTLSYKIESTTWMDGGYSIEGSKLTINDLSISKGSFKVQAFDTQGAYCVFNVKIRIIDIGLLALIGIVFGGIIALIVLYILYRIAIRKPFMGYITVENIQTGEAKQSMKSKGRLSIKSLGMGVTGLGSKAYIQATGKDFVYFNSNKPFTTDVVNGKMRKIKVEHGLDVNIYTDEEQTNGIRIRFESMKRSY